MSNVGLNFGLVAGKTWSIESLKIKVNWTSTCISATVFKESKVFTDGVDDYISSYSAVNRGQTKSGNAFHLDV